MFSLALSIVVLYHETNVLTLDTHTILFHDTIIHSHSNVITSLDVPCQKYARKVISLFIILQCGVDHLTRKPVDSFVTKLQNHAAKVIFNDKNTTLISSMASNSSTLSASYFVG